MHYVLQALVAVLAAMAAVGFLAAIESTFVASVIAFAIVMLAAYVNTGIGDKSDPGEAP